MGEQPIRNEPTPEGRQLGEMLAGWVEDARRADPALREPCFDCAFRRGVAPNGMPATVMNALKCALEREPFWCHLTYDDGKERLCAGWEALVAKAGEAIVAPWPHIEGSTPPDVIQLGHVPASCAAKASTGPDMTPTPSLPIQIRGE